MNKINLKESLSSLKKDALFTKKQNRIKYIIAKINPKYVLNIKSKITYNCQTLVFTIKNKARNFFNTYV